MLFPFDNTYARLPDAFFARVDPTPVSAPQWIALNRDLADRIGVDPDALESDEGLAALSGNRVPEGAEPIAMAYAGHQFGGFAPQLGDGRALLLGEVVGPDGVRRDVQLKGSGPTPFSRRGDGRSALGPVLREYVVSEAMAALGVPTTRALAAVWSGDTVRREEPEPGGVFTRVSRSHLRIGTAEYFAARGEVEHLRTLVDYVIDRHYPESKDSPNPALAVLEGVAARQARLVAQWMGLGFIHGVMNTDNMSLAGETIDYGPCAFLDHYDPEKKFSFIDQWGRYAYGSQATIAQWNLARLGEALFPLLVETEDGARDEAAARANEVLEAFPERFETARLATFGAKIGLDDPGEDDRPLIQSLLDLMSEQRADFTLTFRRLADVAERGDEAGLLSLFDHAEPVRGWLGQWRARLEEADLAPADAAARMREANPVYIPRNHRLEEVIDAARGSDFEPFHRLREVLSAPFEERSEFADFERPPQPHEEVRATFCGT